MLENTNLSIKKNVELGFLPAKVLPMLRERFQHQPNQVRSLWANFCHRRTLKGGLGSRPITRMAGSQFRQVGDG